MVDVAKIKVLTVTEVAQQLRVQTQTVRQMIDRGELKGVKIGKLWRIHASSVETLLGGINHEPCSSEEGDAARRHAATPATLDRRATGLSDQDRADEGITQTTGKRNYSAEKREQTTVIRRRRKAN